MTDELKAAALEIAEREQTYGVAGDFKHTAESGESQRAGAAEIPNTAGAPATPPVLPDEVERVLGWLEAGELKLWGEKQANSQRLRAHIAALDAENKRLREALQKAVDDYGKPGGPDRAE